MRIPVLFTLAAALLLTTATTAYAQSDDCDCPSCTAPGDLFDDGSGTTDDPRVAPAEQPPLTSRAPASAASGASLESVIVDEMNALRRDPVAYAAKLRAMRPFYEGTLLRLPGQVPILTEEGVEALDEAISALGRARPVPPLERAEGLARAAMDHVADLGNNGHVGHFGSDGSSPDERASRHGRWRGSVAENITFGSITASEVVIDLLVDDGVADRGHRRVMLGKTFRRTGVSCGPHPTYRQTCVIAYSDGYENSATTQGSMPVQRDPIAAPEPASRARNTDPSPVPARPEQPRYEAPIPRSPDEEIIEL
ncbi:MAG: hypothetical protein ACI9MR_003138 [Myxococcota bacterium]|jgi:uncharacterized protein YkwD